MLETKNRFFILKVYEKWKEFPFLRIGAILEGIIQKPLASLGFKTKCVLVGLDRSYALISLESGDIVFSRRVIYALNEVKILPDEHKIVVIHEVGCEILKKNGDVIDSYEGEILQSWKIDKNRVFLSYEDGNVELKL